MGTYTPCSATLLLIVVQTLELSYLMQVNDRERTQILLIMASSIFLPCQQYLELLKELH